VRALECMLEQVYSVLEETLQRLEVLVSSTLRELTENPSSFDSEGRREAALARLLPLRISLNSLETRSRRISEILDEILDENDEISDMCLTLKESVLRHRHMPHDTRHTTHDRRLALRGHAAMSDRA
jgi:hypothetical protein